MNVHAIDSRYTPVPLNCSISRLFLRKPFHVLKSVRPSTRKRGDLFNDVARTRIGEEIGEWAWMSGLELKFGGVGMVTAVFLMTRAEQDREQDGQYYPRQYFEPHSGIEFSTHWLDTSTLQICRFAYQSSSLFAALSCPLLRCDESCLCSSVGVWCFAFHCMNCPKSVLANFLLAFSFSPMR